MNKPREYKDDRVKEMADRIRCMALGCMSTNTMSCEFGNEFADKVYKYLQNIKENDNGI